MGNENRIYLTKNDKITAYETNLVSLTLANGESYEELEPRRLFPVYRPDEYITLIDTSRHEIAVIRQISDLDEKSREVIEESLAYYYRIPKIERIISITLKQGKYHWSVITDLGPKYFEIKNGNTDVKVFPDFSIRVRDANDNRYVIPDHRLLDKHSRAKIMSDL